MNKSFWRFWGVQGVSAWPEKIVATLGGLVSILAITYISFSFTGQQGALLIVPSMGAATVLLFAVPHGPLSQPWALFAGNLLSALLGVSCVKVLGVSLWSAAVAVALAIGVMHLTRSIHPPGGATALAAVLGGDQVNQLGYAFVVAPVLINCLVICLTAIVFNGIFPWRRYPLAFMRFTGHAVRPLRDSLQSWHINQAIKELQVFVDVSAAELKTIYDKANDIAVAEKSRLLDIEPGGFYTNGRPGREWAVRQIVDVSPHQDSRHYLIIYRIVDGKGIHATGSCTLAEFTQWANARMQPSNRR